MSRLKILTICVTAISASLLLSGCGAEQNSKRQGPDADLKPDMTYHNTVQVAAVPKPKLPQLSDSSGLEDYLAYGALNNPGLQAAFNGWKASLEKIPQVTALPDPRFNYQYFIQEVETRVGPQKQSVGLTQMFPWFGKLKLRGDIAAQQANAARQRYETAKLKLFYDIKNAYYEYYYLARSTAITRENVTLVQHIESVAVSRYKAASASHPDVIRAQVEIGKLEDRYRALVDLREPILAKLNAVLNRPLDANLPWPGPIEPQGRQLRDEQLLKQLKENNPELKALDYEIMGNKTAVDLAGKDYYPDITLGMNYIDTGTRLGAGPSDDGKDPLIAMLSLNIPLWRDKYNAEVREARLKYIASERQRMDKANSLGSDLKMALYHYRDSQRKIDLYQNALIPKAQESLKVTEAGFQGAQGSFTDLIDAQRILLEFTLSYERALADQGQSMAMIEKLVGGTLLSPQADQKPVDTTVQGPSDDTTK